MPAPATQLQQEIDRALKLVDDGILEFSNCWKEVKTDVAFQDVHGQHEQLKKLSDTLEQHIPQLQSLLMKSGTKSGVRKAQKEKLQAARVSIDQQLDNFKVLEQKLKEKELGANGSPRLSASSSTSSIQVNGIANDSKEGKVDASGVTHESTADNHVKVQWDQVVRETSDDCEMLDEFICKICQVHVVGCGPKLARCSHLFCGDCIKKWFEAQPRSLSWAQRAQSAGRVPCPVCKEPLHEQRDLFPVCPSGSGEGALLWRLLSGVKITCVNSAKCRPDGKCTWTGEYGSYQKHIQTCGNAPLDNAESPAPKCAVPVGKSGTRCNLQQHNSIPPCEKSEDKHEHDVDAIDIGKKTVPGPTGQQVQLEPTQIVAATEMTSSSGLTDLPRQLMDNSEKTPDPGTKTELHLQTPQPLQQQAVEPSTKVCRAVHSFTTDGSSQLEIKVGEFVEVLDEHSSGWTYGRKAHDALGVEGWFPNWVVASE